MIGKVITGRSFGGCVTYILAKAGAVILDAAGVRTKNATQITHDFNLQRKLNPDLGKAVGHLVLSWSPNDAENLSDEMMLSVAKEYLRKMKIDDTQYLIVRHHDSGHPHLHIVYNRVDNNGKTISDNFQKLRNVKVSKELTLKHGFYLARGKDDVKRSQLKGADKVKYELHDAIIHAGKNSRTMDELVKILAQNNITTHFKYKSTSDEIQGISFSLGDLKFKGSEIDRSLSYSRLCAKLERNRLGLEGGLVSELKEGFGQGDNNYSKHHQSEALMTSTQPDIFVNIADDVDDEAVYGKKRQRGRYQITR